MEPESSSTRKWNNLWSGALFHIALIIIVGILIYSNTFQVPFVFDDESSITQNHVIKNLHNFLLDGSGYSYNPRRFVGYLTIALNYHWGGADVTGYHIVNLAIHLASALLVYALARLTLQTPFLGTRDREPQSGTAGRSETLNFVPLLAALLFVVHPVQTQAVPYIIQRLASLSTFFFLLSLVLYARARLCDRTRVDGKRWLLYLLSLLSAILAMRTKEIAFTLPVVVVLYEYLFFTMTPRKRLLFLSPVLLLLFIIPVGVVGSGNQVAELLSDIAEKTRVQTDMPRLDYLFTQFRVIVTYLRLLVLPVNQTLDYDYPIYRSFFTPPVLLSFLLLLAIFWFAVYLLYRTRSAMRSAEMAICEEGACHGRFTLPEWRLVSFGILWFFITLSVESSFIPIVDLIYEHRLYLPSAGAFIAFSTVAAILLRNAPPSRLVAGAAAIVVILAGTTFVRNLVWGDAVTLAEDIARKSPAIPRAHYNLALALDNKGRSDEALREARIAANLDQEDARPRNLIGSILAKNGRYDEAIAELTLAVTLYPKAAYAHLNLANVYLLQGGPQRAMEHLFTALQLTPDDPEIYNMIGKAYLIATNTKEAVSYFERAVAMDPTRTDYRFNLKDAKAAAETAEADTH